MVRGRLAQASSPAKADWQAAREGPRFTPTLTVIKSRTSPSRRMSSYQRTDSCPCHGSKFDVAARVYKNVPAPTNLEIPRHVYLSETRILIGDDRKGA